MLIYIVRPGDTLGDIAVRTGTTVQKLMDYNGLTNSELIYPGQRLLIADTEHSPFRWYVVRRGDTLYTLAKRFNTTVAELVSLNQIADPDRIYPGQILRMR